MKSVDDFKKSDRVKVTIKYPADRETVVATGMDADMWGLVGTVVGHDDKYVFVEPMGLYNDWPKKMKFDMLPEWHFLPEELEKVN